jgi:hypothetical protein
MARIPEAEREQLKRNIAAESTGIGKSPPCRLALPTSTGAGHDRKRLWFVGALHRRCCAT